jgi:hypothetical protein
MELLVSQFARAITRSVLLFVFLLLIAPLSQAQSSPSAEVTRGIQWLLAQVQSNGALLNEQQSIATKLQSRTETAQTLKLLSSAPAGLVSGVDAETESNTEYLARKIIALASNGWNAGNYSDVLQQRQNADGGFGGDEGYASNALDTAWAVLAFAQTNRASTPASASAQAWLKAALAADGGVNGSSDADRIPSSAVVLLALQSASDSGTATATGGLASWLLQRQGADGSWAGNTYLTALTLAAVSPVTADSAVRTNARNFLLSKQSADGSWSGDPFLTALALRALSGQSGSVSTATGTLKGQIIDPVTGAPLAGASIAIAGQENKTVFTDASGSFAAAVVPGTYTVTLTRSGYNGASATYTVIAGQTSDTGTISLTQLAAAAIIRGQVTVAGSGTPLVGAAVAIAGAAQLNAVTDANGRFEFTGVPAGAITITASAAGYQVASGNATAVAGQTLVFSPALYANGQTAPTTFHYTGKTVVSGTGAALPNVAVRISGASTTIDAVSSAAGQFNVTLDPGSYTATFTLAGYETVTQSFVAPAGATIDGGSIAMSAIRTSSTIKGHVVTTANAGIAGASVQIVGTSITVTTSSDGSYVIDNVIGTAFSLRASATGYNSQTINLQLSKPGDVQQDFTLSQQGVSSLAIGELTVDPASTGSGKDVTVATVITNTGNTEASAVVQLQVLDAAKNIVSTGAAYDGSGNLIGQITLAAGKQQNVRFVWNTAQHAPGAYALIVRLVEVGSITRATPQGSLLAERASSVAITGQAHFAGAITANPPVLQAGTNTTVKLSATLQNDGNIDIPAQTVTLTAIDTKTNAVVMTQQVAADAIPVNGLQTLQFPDWTPNGSGNLRLELVAADPSLGKTVGTLYVGDAAKASYTVNKLVVPTGTQTVKGTIKITGQDIVNGSISDPLAPLVKTAIQKSVTYNDHEATNWTARNQCIGCHIQSQALVGGETNRKFASGFDTKQRSTIYNILMSHQRSDGSFYDPSTGFPQTATTLSMWGLDSWHDKQVTAPNLVRGADYLLSKQLAAGYWNYDHSWMGGWTSTMDHTALNVKTLTGLYKALQDAPAGTVRKYSIGVPLSQIYQTNRGFVAADSAGNLYFSILSWNQVIRVALDGTAAETWDNLSDPRGLIEAKDGGVLVTTGDGLFRLTAGNKKTKLNSITDLGNLAYGPDGALYSVGWNSNAVIRMDSTYAGSVFVQDNALNNPTRIAFAPSGDMLVTSNGARAVFLVKADKTIQRVLEPYAFEGTPIGIARYRDGWLLGTTTAIYRVGDDWTVNYAVTARADDFATTPNGRTWFASYFDPGIKEFESTPVDVRSKLASYAQAIGKATDWMLAQDPSSSANTVVLAHQLLGLGEADRFYAGDPSRKSAIETKMKSIAGVLKARQRSDGSWGANPGYAGDSFVTAHVGYALDYLNPSPDDPDVRKAIQWLLSRQQSDGSWYSENGIFSTHLAATSWVSIWLPVMLDRLGGIDTDLTVTFPANVKMSNPDLAPASTTVNTDGTTTVAWKLIGITSVGRTINYDLALADMTPDEVRPVSTDAHLTFKNSFTGGVVDAPIDVPRVKASAFLALGVTTDKVNYPADTPVAITGQITNTGGTLSSGRVKFDIYGPDNVPVASLGSVAFSDVAANASINAATIWNTGTTLAAQGYTVQATLYDQIDRPVGTAQSRFNIVSGAISASGVAAKISIDKQRYLPSDTVRIDDRVTNVTVNAPLSDLRIATTVRNPDGSVRLAKSESLAQLAQGNIKDYAYSLPLAMAPAGRYDATLVVTSADGTVLAQSGTTFEVASSADNGAGLSGTIAALPKEIPQGELASLSFAVTNAGNSVLSGVPLKVSIVDPVAQQVIAEFPYNQTFAIGAAWGGNVNWTGTGPVGTTYVAVLNADIGGKTLTLAQDNITIVVPPIKLAIQQGIAGGSRVLALVSCNDGENDVIASDGKPSVCITQRSQTIDAVLTALGAPHTIVTNEVAFKKALRSGVYNTYWISGKQDKLHDDLAAEVREAVYGGDGLILDGVHDERNKTLDTVPGILYRGKIGETDLPVQIAGPDLTAQALSSSGRALKIELAGGVQEAAFAGSKPNSDGPAIVTNRYGNGRSMLFAFDLVGSVTTQGAWQTVLGSGLQYVLPPQSTSLTPGAVLPVKTTVTNLAKAVDATVTAQLPQGAAVLGSDPSGTFNVDANSIAWTFNLGESQSQDWLLTLRVPAAPGDYTLQTQVATTRNNKTAPYGDALQQTFQVTDAAQTGVQVQQALKALAVSTNKDAKSRDAVLSLVQSALTHLSQNSAAGYEAAVGELVSAIDRLSTIASAPAADLRTIHEGVDRMLKEAEWRWAQATP